MEEQNSSPDQIQTIPERPDLLLHENSGTSDQTASKPQKKPKRVLQFSDGEMVEYSSEDETDAANAESNIPAVNPKTLSWMPWAWYQTVWAGSKVLNGCDYVGEALADFLGITSPKYQFEIEEYKRIHAARAEEAHRQDLEMGGWNESHRNNIITANEPETSEWPKRLA